MKYVGDLGGMALMDIAAWILRFGPLAGTLSLVLVGVGWRSWLQRKRYGMSGFVRFGFGEPSQFVPAGGIVLAFIVLFGQALEAARHPANVDWLARLSPQSTLVVSALGTILFATGLALLVIAQLEMGASWRIGIDEGATPGLVDTGLFRFCRNPIFLAMLVAIAGYCVLLPTALSLLVWFATYLGIRLQIGAEEKYLWRTYGKKYRNYAQRVGRLLPGIGRQR